jgi:hypothetical protein
MTQAADEGPVHDDQPPQKIERETARGGEPRGGAGTARGQELNRIGLLSYSVALMSLEELKRLNADLGTLQWLVGDLSAPSMPVSVVFNSSAACNLRCPHCPTHGTPERKANSNRTRTEPSLLRRLAAETLPFAETFNPTLVGEPLLTPGFSALLREWLPLGARLEMTTNATLLSPEWIESILPIAGMVQISVDGASPRIFEALRLGAKYEIFLRNARLLARTRALATDTRVPHLSLACVCMASNLRELPLLVDLARFLGFDAVRFDRISVKFDTQRAESVDRHMAQFNHYRRLAIERGSQAGVEVHFFTPPFEGVDESDVPVSADGLLVADLPDEAYYRAFDFAAFLDREPLESEAVRLAEAVRARVEGAVGRAGGEAGHASALTRTAEQITALRNRHADRLMFLAVHPTHPLPYCSYLHQKAFFAADGRMYPCCYGAVPVVGDASSEPVHHSWNGAPRRRMAEGIMRGDPHEVCKGCVQGRMVEAGQLSALLSNGLQGVLAGS